MESLNSLPNEVLDNIFKYVLDREDIKTCRLVCHLWYFYFDSRSVREQESFVFDSKLCSTAEINDVLQNYGGSSQINVSLVSQKLAEIKFQDFGEKIRGLRLVHYEYNDKESLKNIFTFTPNLVYFQYDEFCLDWGFRGSSKFPEVFVMLGQCGFTNNNLRMFDTNDMFSPTAEMYQIFPHLESLRIESKKLRTIVNYNIPIKPDLKELARIQVSMGKDPAEAERRAGIPEELCRKDIVAERNFLMSLPKLKRLEIDFWFTREENQSSFNLCLDFFSRQTELESLYISFRCQTEKYLTWTYQNTDKGHRNVNCRAKVLLFHVLKNCRNLEILHFDLRCEDLQFNDADMQEFARAIRLTKIKELKFPVIALYCNAFTSHLALLQNLESLELYDFHWSNDNQGRQPKLSVTEVYEALSVVLQSNKNLKKLTTPTMYLYHADNIENNEELKVNQIYHGRLQHLRFRFEDPETKPSLVEYLMSWELPQLRTLELPPIYDDHAYVTDSGTKKRLMEWIGKMPFLKKINLRFIYLTVDDILEICKRLLKLQVITFESKTRATSVEYEKLRELFRNFPTVKQLTFVQKRLPSEVDRFCNIDIYFVKRQKKLVLTRGSRRFSDGLKPFMSL